MSEKLPWFQFYATDWISDEKVRLLSGRQRGWYIDLLAHDWQEGGIPLSVRLAQNLTSFREDCAYEEAFLSDDAGDWRAALQKEFDEVFSFFSDNGNGRCSHKRLREQRQQILVKSAKQREGALLTNARRKADNAKRNGNRSANRSAKRDAKRALSDAVSVSVSAIEPEPELDIASSSSVVASTLEKNPPLRQLAVAKNAAGAETGLELKKTARALRQFFASTDDAFVAKLATLASQAAAGVEVPKLELTDELLADAVRQCREESPYQRSAGLFLQTVPRLIALWLHDGRESIRKPTFPQTRHEAEMDSIVAELKAQRLAKEAAQ